MVEIASVKNSLNKHESDIPQIGISDALTPFFKKRQKSLIQVKATQHPINNRILDDHEAVISKLINIEKTSSLGKIGEANLDYLFKLEKKFVLYGLIYSHYNDDMKPVSDLSNLPDIYCKLALLLLKLVKLENGLNSLNSAIRLLDKCCELLEQGHHLFNKSDLVSALAMEQVILMGLMPNE